MEITVENIKGKKLTLTNDETKYQVHNVTGHTPPKATLTFNENINDGDEFTHSHVGRRNIVIDLYINGNVEENRNELYQYFQAGEYIKVYLSTRTKKVWTEGQVETIEIDNYQNKTTCQISILCPDPWLKSLEEILEEMNTVKSLFYFPFYTVEPIPFSEYASIQILNLLNQGNVKSGMTIEIYARGQITNPIIYNRETREYIGLGSAERPYVMQPKDRIIITTHTNNKKIKLIRNAVETNIFNYLKEGSKFLNLSVGDNIFTYSADSGNEYIDINFRYYANYEGV